MCLSSEGICGKLYKVKTWFIGIIWWLAVWHSEQPATVATHKTSEYNLMKLSPLSCLAENGDRMISCCCCCGWENTRANRLSYIRTLKEFTRAYSFPDWRRRTWSTSTQTGHQPTTTVRFLTRFVSDATGDAANVTWRKRSLRARPSPIYRHHHHPSSYPSGRWSGEYRRIVFPHCVNCIQPYLAVLSTPRDRWL